MNVPRLYWASRLNTGKALHHRAVAGIDYFGRMPWPEWVSRKALWEDYQAWFTDVYLPVYQHPMARCPGSVTDFFDALRPYLYGPYRNGTATTFPVEVQDFHRGKWLRVVVRRKFIRLPSHQEACELYDEEYRRLTAA